MKRESSNSPLGWVELLHDRQGLHALQRHRLLSGSL